MNANKLVSVVDEIMPAKRYVLERGGQELLEISWESSWKNVTIRLDGKEIGSVANKEELKEGREFHLGDGSTLKVQLVKGLEVSIDGKPLPGSTSHPEEQLKVAYGVIFFIAGLSIVVGLVAEIFEVEFLLQRGIGFPSIIEGSVFLVLGFYVKRRSAIALGISVGLFALDAIFSVVDVGITSSIGVIVWRIALLPLMIKGFGAISSLKSDDAGIWYDKGVEFGRMGLKDEAIEAYKKAIEIKSDYADALFNRACIYSTKGEKEKALIDLKKAIEIDSSNKEEAKKDNDFKNLWNDEEFKKLYE